MHKSTHHEPAATFEAMIRDAARRGDTPAAILQHGPAVNDASCEDPAIHSDDRDDRDDHDVCETWARHALAANGFGGASADDTASSVQPVGDDRDRSVAEQANPPPLRPARGHRSFALQAVIVAAIHSAAALAHRAYARHQQRRQMKSIGDLLRGLDDHTLRDLGFHRSEISSVAAEMAGAAECTRVHVERALRAHQGARRS